MAIHADHHTAGSIRRASIACVACRARRIRCDGDSKRNRSCTHCREGDSACHFPRNDGRKRSRIDLAKLQDRITALERSGRSISIPTKVSNDRPTSPMLTFAASHDIDSQLRDSQSEEDTAEVTLDSSLVGRDYSDVRIRTVKSKRDRSHPFLHLSPAASTYLCVDQQGQLRYFGYTSSMQVVPSLQSTLLGSPPEITSPEADMAKPLADSLELQRHLVDLYFTYQDIALPIVQKDVFMKDWIQGKRSQYFSKFLLYSILARSVRLSDHPDTALMAPLFQSRARSQLLDELDDPTVATIQALCIYGLFLTGIGNERGCWLYPGMAFRLAYDLGLHQDCLHLVGNKTLTERDRGVRISTMWGCYVLDKYTLSALSMRSSLIQERMYSFCQGRPSAIRLEELNVPRPSLDVTGPQYAVLVAFVDLSSNLDKMSAILNSSPETLAHADSLETLSELANKLLLWLKSLPDELQLQTQSFNSPAVCALHMQLLTAFILMHRPFADYGVLTSRGSTLPRLSSQLPGYARATSRLICTQNSRRVAKFLQVFRQHYGIRKVFSMGGWIALTAAMSLALELSSTTQDSKDLDALKEGLDICVNALQELGQSFPLARKHHRIVLSFLKFCGLPTGPPTGHSELLSSQTQPQHERTSQPQDSLVPQPIVSEAFIEPPGNQTEVDWWSWFVSQPSTIPWNGSLPFENDGILLPVSAEAIDLATAAPIDEHMWDVWYIDHDFGVSPPNSQTMLTAEAQPPNRIMPNKLLSPRLSSLVGQRKHDTVYGPITDIGSEFASYSLPEPNGTS